MDWNTNHRRNAGDVSGNGSEAQHKDHIGQKAPVLEPQALYAHVKAGREDLPRRPSDPELRGVQCIIDRKLLKHSCTDQQKKHENEYDPADRVFDKFARIVPGDHFRIISDQPQPLRPGHERKDHHEGENPKNKLKPYQASS